MEIGERIRLECGIPERDALRSARYLVGDVIREMLLNEALQFAQRVKPRVGAALPGGARQRQLVAIR